MPQAKIVYVIGEPLLSIHRKRSLEAAGYSVVCVKKLEHAVQLSESQEIALMLLDHHAVDGARHDWAVHLRQRNPDLPVVVLTSQHLGVDHFYAWADQFLDGTDQAGLLQSVASLLAGRTSQA